MVAVCHIPTQGVGEGGKVEGEKDVKEGRGGRGEGGRLGGRQKGRQEVSTSEWVGG